MGWGRQGRPFEVPTRISAHYTFDDATGINRVTVTYPNVDALTVEMTPVPQDQYVSYPDASQLPLTFHFDPFADGGTITKAANYAHVGCPAKQSHQIRVKSEVRGPDVPAAGAKGYFTYDC